MKLTFFGAAHAVTGSCHCLEVNGKKILIDCGLQQGRDEHDDNTLDFAPNYIDYVLVTHAHIDHSGRLPLLGQQHPQDRAQQAQSQQSGEKNVHPFPSFSQSWSNIWRSSSTSWGRSWWCSTIAATMALALPSYSRSMSRWVRERPNSPRATRGR